MEIFSAEFVTSSVKLSSCPPTRSIPEFAFIGRSNVGKSSLINMLVNKKNLAKTSNTPGKTQTINHFLVNNKWHLVDLPGYGFASVGRNTRKGWSQMTEEYLTKRENLYCTFILLDSRLEPQKIDFEFIEWMGSEGLPIAILMTKADKLKQQELTKSKKAITTKLLETWEETPPLFVTSSAKKLGRKELLQFISDALLPTKPND
jgi:GTP-binding protein